MKFTLSSLLVFAMYFAFAFMTLTNPNGFWEATMPFVRGTVLAIAVIAVFHSGGIARSVYLTFAVFGLIFSSVVNIPWQLSSLVAETLAMPEWGVVSEEVYQASHSILDDHLILGLSLVASIIGIPIFSRVRNEARLTASAEQSREPEYASRHF